MQLLMAWSYFSSALIKLRVAGLSYLSADNLPALAILHSLDNLHDTDFRLAFKLPAIKSYLPLAVGFILVWELVFPLAIFWRRIRWWILGVGIAFHISTLVLMNIFFPPSPRPLSDLRQLGSQHRKVHGHTSGNPLKPLPICGILERDVAQVQENLKVKFR